MLTRGALLVVSVVCLLSGCGETDEEETRATLSDGGCTYIGETTLDSGLFNIAIENETEHFGAFAVARLSGGTTIETLEPFLQEAQAQFDENGTLPDLPTGYEQVVRAGIEAGAAGSLPVDVGAGTYALMCFVDDLPTWRVYAAAQLDVVE